MQDEQRRKEVEKVELSETEKTRCLQFWKKKDLMKRIDELLEQVGIIGEENNRRLGFCIVSSARMPEPLHGLIQGK